MRSFVPGPSPPSRFPDEVDGGAEFCHRVSFAGSEIGNSIIRSHPH